MARNFLFFSLFLLLLVANMAFASNRRMLIVEGNITSKDKKNLPVESSDADG